MIPTTAYGEQIIRIALGYAIGWREQNCKEDDKSCYQYLFANNYDDVLYKDWCAYFVTRVINQAAEPFRLKCPIPFNGASKSVVTYAQKNGIRVDKTPAIGCLFWYPRAGSTTLGHTGIDIWQDAKGIYTVEGNSSDALRCNGCPKNAVAVIGSDTVRSYKSMADKGTLYIHIEELGNTPKVNIDNIFGMPVSTGQQKEKVLNAGMSAGEMLLLTSVLAGGIYYATK